MSYGWLMFVISFGYIGLLFAIASYGDRRAESGNSIINNPYVYALSLAVYCTAWTFYGSVGRAATAGIGFLPIYLGPTLVAAIWWFVMRKIIIISKANRITSIADFIASRYGKSMLLGGFVTIIAVLGIVPYISLQLKAVSTSFTLLWNYPEIQTEISTVGPLFTIQDTPFYVAMLLAMFAILFGTRHLDVTEHHEGLVAAIAFESLVKLLAFIGVGLFVSYGLFNGLGDIFRQAALDPALQPLLSGEEIGGSYLTWASLMILSIFAIMFLPRQFQMTVIENMDEAHLYKAMWLFPLYLLLINIFVLPIALGGRLHFGALNMDADTFVLTLPMSAGRVDVALLAFIGGLSAATSMVIVATVALSTMVSNDLVMPLLLRIRYLRLTEWPDLNSLILSIRRFTIIGILLLSYSYFRVTGESSSLVSTGLISFAAVAQFAPAILGGIYWEDGTRLGAIWGLLLGFLVWGYTLPLPALVSSGLLSESLLSAGPFGFNLLRPYHLFGLDGLDPVTHSLFWSLLFNLATYVTISVLGKQDSIERAQAAIFVNAAKYVGDGGRATPWRGQGTAQKLCLLLGRFLGEKRAEDQMRRYAQRRGQTLEELLQREIDRELVNFTETLLSGSIGAASARVAIASVAEEEPVGNDEILEVLNEASQLLAYSRELEERTQQLQKKSQELERATYELRSANERLTELDHLKDDFISTVTHELRTPLTSIRSFTEILSDNPDLQEEQRAEFLQIVLTESERLSRLINQVLDISRLESGGAEWHPTEVDIGKLIQESVDSMQQIFNENEVELTINLPAEIPPISIDPDRITQVLINLLSNARKFCAATNGKVAVNLSVGSDGLRIDVTDNGMGLDQNEQQIIFDKFRQVSNKGGPYRQGSGLGLPICRQIIARSGGTLWVESTPGEGATFSFTLPYAQANHSQTVDSQISSHRPTINESSQWLYT